MGRNWRARALGGEPLTSRVTELVPSRRMLTLLSKLQSLIHVCVDTGKTGALALLLGISAASGCVTSRTLVLPPDINDSVDRYTVAGQIDMFPHEVTFGP